MAQVTRVTAPVRKPRSGGIKDIVGDFIHEQRLSATTAVVWEDSGCALPSLTRAGCYDTTFPLSYSPVEVDDDGNEFVFTREGETVTVTVTIDADAVPEGFTAPWPPSEAVNQAVGGGAVTIGVDGVVDYTGTPDGEQTFTYTAVGTAGGFYPPKEPGGVGQFEGIVAPFALFAGVECYLGGDDEGASYVEQARALLEQGEDREVESALWEWAAAGDAITPAGSVETFATAIGELEEYADTAYVGLPVIILSRAAATLAKAEGVIVRDEGKLYTVNGVPVLATGAVGDEDQAKVSIIGQPAVYASDVVAYAAPKLAANRAMALAERVYTLGVDCDFRASIEVTA